MILAGDIGGTKTNLALFKLMGGKLEIQVQGQFSSQEFASFMDVIVEFEKSTSLKDVQAACFGVAGPVINGKCRTTNLPWEISETKLKEHLNIEKAHLMNDLEATAYGMLYLPENEFVNLNPSGRDIDGNRAVIAAGTGLGEGILFYDGKKYHPIASEGGHCDFAPVTSQQDELLKWMRKRYPNHVSFERILCGSGVYALYEFLKESSFAIEPSSMLNIKDGVDKSALVSELAIKDNDPLCMETLRLFAKIYGAEAGNLALKSMSVGGIYIGGGIAPKILSVLEKGDFLDSFVSKGRFKELLLNMQVKVSLNVETALFGAAHFANDLLK